MIETAVLALDFHDWWHCSAGLSMRSGVSALVIRDDALPIVPGNTLKGLLREALQQAEDFGRRHAAVGARAHVPAGATNWLLGHPAAPEASTAEDFARRRNTSEPGRLIVDTAHLPLAWQRWARTEQGERTLADLGTILAATAIDDDGQVVPHTLRSLEVMPPMTLEADLTLTRSDGDDLPAWMAPAGGWRAVVQAALPLLRMAGARRNRGLGRLTARLRDSVAPVGGRP